MAFVFKSAVTVGSIGGGDATTAGIDTSAWDFFVGIVGSYSGGAAASFADNKSNAISSLTGYVANNNRVRIFYPTTYPINTDASNHTFTGGGGVASFPSVVVLGFSGVRSSSPFDAGKDAGASTASSTTLAPTSVTPSEDNCVVITGLSWTSSETPVADGGFVEPTNYFTDYLAGNHFGSAGAYLIQTSAAAANPNWTWGAATEAIAAIAVFRAAAGGAVFVAAPGLNVRQAVKRASTW